MNIKFLSENNVSRKGFFLVFLVFSLLVVSVFSVFAQTTTSATSGTSFPVNPPAGEVTGGYFQRYFDNIFNTGTLCPTGQALVGFRYESGTPLYNNDTTGTPVCRPIGAADGLASGFTGGLVGTPNYIPMYNQSGTGLVDSIASQSGGIVIQTRSNTSVVPLKINQNTRQTNIATFERTYNNKTLGFGIYAYPAGSVGSNAYLNGTMMLYATNATDFLNITAVKKDSAIRFLAGGEFDSVNSERMRITKNGVGIGTTNPTQKLDIAGKIKITDGSQGVGKVLTSDATGIATWKDIPHPLPLDCAVPGKNKNHTCFGKDALGRASETFNDTAFGYAAGRHLKGNSNVFMGHVAFGNGYTATGNVVIGAEAANTFVNHLKENVIIGYRSFERFEKGENNVMIGAHAGRNPTGFGGAKMNNSIIIGGGVTHHGGYNTTTNNYLNIGNWITGQDGNISIGSPANISTTGPKFTVNGKIKITDGSQGSGKVLVSDANGLARWETASFGDGSNPNNCSATEKVVNGHRYPVRELTHENGATSTFTENITNGRREWIQRFKCEKGSIKAEGGEQSSIFCNNGKINNGSACIDPPTPPSTSNPNTNTPITYANCSAMNYVHNGRTYNVSAIKHNFSATSYSTRTIANGVENYKQNFACDNATVSPLGQEEKISVTCNAGYTYNGSSCVRGGSDIVNNAFSGTLCNTANVRVVDITPGTDKIPENLDADTLYRLSAGAYNITKKINLNNCSAIVGAGTGQTTIGYSGISYNSETLIHGVNKDNVIIMNLSIDGQINSGKLKDTINISGTFNAPVKTKIENVFIGDYIDTAIVGNNMKGAILNNIAIDGTYSEGNSKAHKGMSLSNFKQGLITNIDIKNLSSTGMEFGGAISENSLSHITISNISSSSSSYGINFSSDSSSNNNTLSHITISNISSSSSSSSSYGINFSPDSSSSNNNTLSHITISNISSSSSYGINFSSDYSYSSDNNTLSHITISNISSSSSSSYGINFSSSNNNTLSHITISNISSSSSYGINFSSFSDNNTLSYITISNISSSSSYSYGINFSSSSDNNTLSYITISTISASYYSYGINSYSSDNNTFSHITISNISSSSSSYGINLSSSNNNTLSHITISNISASSSSSSSYGINFSSSSNNNTLFHITISNISASSSYSYGINFSSSSILKNILIINIKNGYGVQISGSKNNLSNIIVAYTGRDGIKINSTSSNNNIIHNFLSYNNGGAGVWMDGSNNSISRGYIFNNGGKAVDGGGNSNFYFNNLTMFRNVGGNTATPLGRGLGSFWRSTNPFNNGTIVTTGAFSNDWIVRPTNVPGFNPATRGYQDRLSWSGSINWAFGSRVPLQVTPIIPSECTLSVTSTTPCQLQLGGIGDYSANKKIAQP